MHIHSHIGHFLSVYYSSSVYYFSKFDDGSTSSPGCSVINESPGLFKFWADPVEPWITIKSPKAAIWSRGKQNNLAANFICLAQSRNRERCPSCLASQRRYLGNVASWAQGTFLSSNQRASDPVQNSFMDSIHALGISLHSIGPWRPTAIRDLTPGIQLTVRFKSGQATGRVTEATSKWANVSFHNRVYSVDTHTSYTCTCHATPSLITPAPLTSS